MELASEKLVKIGLRPWVYDNPQTVPSFWFEKVDGNELRLWTAQHLPHCTAICLVYLVFAHFSPSWMKHRKALKLEFPLFIWNVLLTVFSICGAARIMPQLLHLIRGNKFYSSLCIPDYINYPETFWSFAFTLSKIFELGDTVFLVLRKKPVSFLHCFHHLTMLWTSFYMYQLGEPSSRYAVLVNYTVHSLMYSYFALKALNIRIPKPMSMALTGLQIIQFLMGLFGNVYTAVAVANGEECFRTITSIRIAIFVLCCYTILFTHFFYKSYIVSTKSKSV